MDIKLLQKQGLSIRQIALLTGFSRNTVRRLLRQTAPQPFQNPHRKSLLDDFKPYIEKRFQECSLSAVRLLDEIQPMGYTGSVDSIRRYLRSIRPLSRALAKATVRFETPPGHQAQCDWSYCGRFSSPSGSVIPLYCFACQLSFSRYLYIEFTTSMNISWLIECHIRAFDYFGGWCETFLYDNMKQVRLSRDTLNPLFLDFATHYGFAIKTHKPRRPRTKGKIERVIDYIKDNFLNGRVFSSIEDVNLQGRNWLDRVANVRIHATTDQRPVDLLNAEKLIPLDSISPYRLRLKEARKVSSEGLVSYCGSRYSVPPEHVGKTVLVEQSGQRIIIRSNDLILFDHPRAERKGSRVVAAEHIEAMWKMTLDRPGPSLPHWEIRFNDEVAQTQLREYEEVL
jgi:transposase